MTDTLIIKGLRDQCIGHFVSQVMHIWSIRITCETGSGGECGDRTHPTDQGYHPLARECNTTLPTRRCRLGLDAPVGFEPTSPGPKPDVFPLNEGAVDAGEGIEPSFSDSESGVLPLDDPAKGSH